MRGSPTISYAVDGSFTKNTEAYKKLLDIDFSKEKFRTKNDNTYLISIDFKQANYNSVKSLDDKGEFKNSWEEFCLGFDIHPTLVSSKSFRQIIFGNTNPKRLQRIQQRNTLKIIKKLIELYGFEEDDFVFISHDEFIVRLRPDNILAVNRIFLLNKAVGIIISNEKINMPTHYKVFKNEIIENDIIIRTNYNVKMGGLSEKHKTLHSVQGNKFFKYFKKHILNEKLNKLDLMFIVNGDICVWSEKDNVVVEINTPTGELTIDEVKREYPIFFEKLNNDVSGLNNSQIRKIINIAISIGDVF